MKSAYQRNEEQRATRLKELKEAIANGTLVVRQMTPEERKQFPPRPVTGRRRRPKLP